jgi:mRNA interferase RelE/StbE
MPWAFKISSGAEKNLRDIGPSAACEIFEFIEKRFQGNVDPRAFGKPLRQSKHGLWRYRVRDYRIICRIEDSVFTVLVVVVGHRSTVYDE